MLLAIEHIHPPDEQAGVLDRSPAIFLLTLRPSRFVPTLCQFNVHKNSRIRVYEYVYEYVQVKSRNRPTRSYTPILEIIHRLKLPSATACIKQNMI